MDCPACGSENEAARKFCGECGSPLAQICPSCGEPNAPAVKFCGECGAPLAGGRVPGVEAQVARAPEAERRLVSVLFADLVGFTTLSESRDSEEVRELLSKYFDTCRTLIARYGGVVEKFIGDAVMAVWGTPIANEDDAERAVRTALDLTTAVEALGQEIGSPDLRARVGVLTGESAVTIGAEGQGMVAGDIVNTASRIQGVADPGAVFVGEATKRASDEAIVYQEAGSRELKGKAEPVPVWRAIRVVGGRGGALKSTGLEAPFVGRNRELRLIKELFHASAEERKAHLVSVVGIAGTGKSRLSWEFFKYIDGLVEEVRWHRGRCLPYGEGVTYWARAEMVRTRAGIREGEEQASALEKLHRTVEESIRDPEEGQWVEPRLAHLLGLEERASWDRENLFSAWRLFYERLSEEMPTVMVYEDMQWADPSMLDFIEYLLEWSKNHALFVLALARPEMAERHPGWGAGMRNATSLYLEPLHEDAMDELLAGLVPGLPRSLCLQILERAEGVPLYAVETVRMLLDRGLLVQEGASYKPAGPIETLEVPETLHALIAARLDGLTREERQLLQDGAVLGKTFRISGLSALSGLSEPELEPLLASLVKKEVLSLQADPLSPERGQYGFLQDLVKRVAYETLSKRDRKDKHVASARFIEEGWGPDEEEFVEVVAAHYLAAYHEAPDAPDAEDIKAHAKDRLIRAAERAASLAASQEAHRYFEKAAELANDPSEQAGLFERAGMMARMGGRSADAQALLERAMSQFERMGQTHPAARVSARLADIMWDRGRLAEAVDNMDRSFRVLAAEEPDENLAALASELGRLLFFTGETDAAAERIEVALKLAEELWLPEILSQALNTKAITMLARGRRQEALALMRYALEVALEHEIPSAALRAHYNLADLTSHADRYQEAWGHVRSGLLLARRAGNRYWEWQLLAQSYPAFAMGEWDEVLAMADGVRDEATHQSRAAMLCFLSNVPYIHLNRGAPERAREDFAIFTEAESSADIQERAMHAVGKAALLREEGRFAEAVESAEVALRARDAVAISHEAVKEAYVHGVEAAFDLNDVRKVEELLAIVESLPRGGTPQLLQAHSMRFRARLAALHGEKDGVESGFKGAAGLFREMVFPFYLAATLLEHGEWLSREGRSEEARPLLSDAREIFERLEARPWLQRLDGAQDRLAATQVASP